MMVVDEEEVAKNKMMSFPVSAKQQYAIWDNTNHVKINASQ